MKTDVDLRAHLPRSVIAVPPLCRRGELGLEPAENRNLVAHLEGGGVRTLLYGGNANLYHIAVSEYAALLDLVEEITSPDTVVVPSAGPHYGTLVDQAEILRGRAFPAVMVLPATFPSTPAGVQAAVRRFVGRAGIPAVIYLKEEGYLTVDAVRELVDEGLVAFIKYAVVRADPAEDRFLRELVDAVDPALIVSGIGEQPAPVHLRAFGLAGFTSGCVCVAPALSTALLRALAEGDEGRAEAIRRTFEPLENLRNAHGPIPVLHHAVALAGVAATGSHLPLLSDLPTDVLKPVETAARDLLDKNADARPAPAKAETGTAPAGQN